MSEPEETYLANLFKPGAEVEWQVPGAKIRVIVLAVMVQTGQHVQYKIAYCLKDERKEVWVDSVEVGEATETISIGFTAG